MKRSCPMRLPTKIGETKRFTAHGVPFQIKKVGRNDYFLARDVTNPSRSRWGSARQICQDLGHVLAMGALPVPKGHGF